MLVKIFGFVVVVLMIILSVYLYDVNQQKKAVETIAPLSSAQQEQRIILNEYLLLMEEGEAQHIESVLKKFDLKLLEPLGEWLLVTSRDAAHKKSIVSLNSAQAQESELIRQRIEAHPFVHTVTFNFIEPDDGSCLGCGKKNPPSSDDSILEPHDPLFPKQWHLAKDADLHLPGAWAITTGSKKTVIALVDRNFLPLDPDMDGARCISRSYYYENVLDYVPERIPYAGHDLHNHGAQVLNVLAPCTDNGLGLSGIDWHAQIFMVDTLGDQSLSMRMFGLLWAAGINVCNESIAPCPKESAFQRNRHPANIINASFGFSGPHLLNPPYGPVLDVIGRINREGRMIVSSAGNEAELADRRLPGAAGGVISVASSNEHGIASGFNNFSRKNDVLAPGEGIFGWLHNRVMNFNGTSFSTPIVSGVIGLMLSVNPELSWKQAEYILKKTARPLSCHEYCPSSMPPQAQQSCQEVCCKGEQVICGAGIVDAQKAVAMAKNGPLKVPLIDFDDYYLPLSFNNNLRMTVSVKNWGQEDAVVRLRKTHDKLNIFPETFTLPAAKNYVPSKKEITVYFDSLTDEALVISLVLEARARDASIEFLDSIEAIVEITPDHPTGKKRYHDF